MNATEILFDYVGLANKELEGTGIELVIHGGSGIQEGTFEIMVSALKDKRPHGARFVQTFPKDGDAVSAAERLITTMIICAVAGPPSIR